MSGFVQWTPAEARDCIAVPREGDDKYSRGVLGMVTGSEDYPGAAVLGVDAALHTGVGMVRYLGPERATKLVHSHRPEAVTVDGRVQAWLLGSGTSADGDSAGNDPLTQARFVTALGSGHPLVLDAGAIGYATSAAGAVVITPHYGELASTIGVDVAEIAAEPESWAERARDILGATILLKGHTTYVCGAGGKFTVTAPTTWLATAGTGDSLAGILGALVATHTPSIGADDATLTRLAATAVLIHGHAALRAGAGGPFTVLDLNAAIPGVIAGLRA